MNDGKFQWDDAKAAKNYAKHGVTFERARDVFKDLFAIEQIDDRHDEERFTRLGMARRSSSGSGVHSERRQHPHHFSTRGGTL